MTKRATLLTPSTFERIWFILPSGFFEISLDDQSQERASEIRDAVDHVFPDATEGQKSQFALQSVDITSSLAGLGAEYLSTCLFKKEDGTLSQGVFTVFVKEVESGDPLDTVQGIGEQWKREHSDAEVAGLHLPYGPAALATREEYVDLPGSIFGIAEEQRYVLRHMQLAVPLRGGSHAALFDFTTTDTEEWHNYLMILSEVFRSITAGDPDN